MLQLTESLKLLFIETANNLKGHERRRFMALTVKELGKGGQSIEDWRLKIVDWPLLSGRSYPIVDWWLQPFDYFDWIIARLSPSATEGACLPKIL